MDVFAIFIVSVLLGFVAGKRIKRSGRARKNKGFHGNAYTGDIKKWDERMRIEYEAEMNLYREEDMEFYANKEFE